MFGRVGARSREASEISISTISTVVEWPPRRREGAASSSSLDHAARTSRRPSAPARGWVPNLILAELYLRGTFGRRKLSAI
jgi:hypothetical protein